MPGSETTSTASWPCGGWEWRIGRTLTGMRIKPKPTSSSRCVKAQHRPVPLFGFSYYRVFGECIHSAAVSGIWQGFPILEYMSCSKDSNIHAVCGVQYPWQPSSKEDLKKWMVEKPTSEFNYKQNKNM